MQTRILSTYSGIVPNFPSKVPYVINWRVQYPFEIHTVLAERAFFWGHIYISLSLHFYGMGFTVQYLQYLNFFIAKLSNFFSH